MVTTPVIDRPIEAPAPAPTAPITLADYRTITETASERLEYCNGEIITMPGGSFAHSRIATNILGFLIFMLRDTDFQVCNGDMRIWIPEFNCGTYADALVIDGEPEFHDQRTDEILNPLLIVEVLSPSTQSYDRGDKFRKYRSMPSLKEYILISQTEAYLEHYSQLENQKSWQLHIHDHLDQKVTLPNLNLAIPLTEIYRRINLDNSIQ